MFNKGRMAVKIAGRDPGVCVILDKKEGKVQVFGPNVRKRFVSTRHLEPLKEVLDVKALDEEKLLEVLKKAQSEYEASEPDFLTLRSLKAKLLK